MMPGWYWIFRRPCLMTWSSWAGPVNARLASVHRCWKYLEAGWGVRGVPTTQCVCAGLAIRDASMIASGVPGRLRRHQRRQLR